MATISELRLKVEVDGGKLKVLEAGLENVSRKAQDTGKKGAHAFGTFNRAILDTPLKPFSAQLAAIGKSAEESGKKGTASYGAFRTQIGGATKAVLGLGKGIAGIAASIAGIAAVGGLAAGMGLLVSRGIEYNKQLETSQIGIAAILSSTQEVTNEYDRQLLGAEKFAASLTKAKDIQEELQIINLETSATSEEILGAYQGLAAPAAAAGIEIENQLTLTKLLIQSTKTLGLQSNQITQEARDLLTATIDRNSQLAQALGITNEQLEQAKEQGQLFEFLSEKLQEFARAGELTQASFEGMTSNLQDAVSRFTGQGFDSFFNALKRHLGDISNELVTVEDGQIKVNQKWLGMAATISDVLVGALDTAVSATGYLLNVMSGGVDAAKKFLAPPTHLGGLKIEVESTQSSVDLLQGSYGPFIEDLKVSEGVYRDTSATANQLASAMGNMSTEVGKVAGAMANAKGPVDDYFAALQEGLRKAFLSPPTHFGNTPIADINAQKEREEAAVIRAGRAHERYGNQVEISNGQLVLASNTSSEAGRRFGKLNLTFNEGGEDAYLFSSAIADFGGGADGAAKKANTLADEILRLRYEIEGIGKNPEELIAIEAGLKLAQGESAKLVEEWQRLALVRQRGLVGQETLDNLKEMLKGIKEETTAVGLSGIALKKHELAIKAANLPWHEFTSDVAPEVTKGIFDIDKALDELRAAETAQSVTEGFTQLIQSMRTEAQKLGDTLAANVNLILQAATVRPDLIGFEEANALIIKLTKETLEEQVKAEREAYIERLKASDSFFDNLKGGYLEFANAVESNGELVSQFFANTLTEMSQNFSDFFYNAVTGKFESLVDVAKSAFDSILRAFIDMVSAIATRQIVISIAGAFGTDTKGAKATDVLGLGKQAVDVAGSAIGTGGAAAGAIGSIGSSGITLGSETLLFGSSAGSLGLAGETIATSGGLLSSIGSAIPYIGAAIAVIATAIPIISGLLKKTPRLDIDFDSVKTDLARRAAVVEEFLNPEFFADSIGQVSVKRGGVGIGAGGDDKILDLIQERIEGTIEGIQDIIRKLPTDIFDTLNETLLNAEIDIDTVIGGERLLEFDAKGKKIAEKFQAFIEGELPAKFFLAIRESFFDPALEALGVSAEGTEKLIDKFLADMESAGSREARAQIGAEFLATFNAFVDAFNIVSGNVNDAIGQTIQSIDSLSSELGFDAVPSIDELRSKLGELINEAEIDPEVVQQYADLRNAIVSVTSELVSSITGLVGKINQLNQTIVSLGGSAVDTSGFLSTTADQLQSFLMQEMGNLSLGEQEAFLDQLAGVANEMLAQEMAAFEAQQAAAREAAEAAAEAQRQAIQNRIDGLGEEKNRIQEAYRARIDGLNEELRIAEGFKSLTQSIRSTLESIILGPESVLTGVEKVNMLQGEIGSLQRELASTSDPEKQLDIAEELRDAFSNLNSAAADAFGVGSPEFVAIFDQVTGGLESLAGMTEARARTVEEIQAEIERLTAEQNSVLEGIDAQIASLRESMSSIQAQNVEATFQASDRVKELFEYIRTEYTRILEERMDQLSEISETGFTSELEGLGTISGQFDSALVTLKDQLTQMEVQTDAIHQLADAISGIPGYASGSGGVRDFGMQTLAFLHGREAIVTEDQLKAMAQDLSAGMGLVERLGSALTGSHIKDFAESITGGSMVPDFLNRVAGQMSASALMGDQEGLIAGLLENISDRGAISEFADEVAGRASISRLLRNIEAGGGGSGAISELVAELEGRGRQGQGRNVTINIPITISAKASSAAADAALPSQIEELIVRSVRKGKVRKEIQKAAKENFS